MLPMSNADAVILQLSDDEISDTSIAMVKILRSSPIRPHDSERTLSLAPSLSTRGRNLRTRRGGALPPDQR